jgi:hypothetical protein
MLHDAQRTSAPSALQRLDQNGGLDRHVQRAGNARALQRLASPNSSRQAIRPGISVSAMSSSLRPKSASAISAGSRLEPRKLVCGHLPVSNRLATLMYLRPAS